MPLRLRGASRALFGLGCGVVAATAPAAAQVVEVEVRGVVFDVTDHHGILDGSVPLGGAMRGEVVYDAAAATDLFPSDPAFGFFQLSIPPASLRVEVGSYVFEGVTPLRITVADGGIVGDEVSYRQEGVVAEFPGVPAASIDFLSIAIIDASATAIASDALPTAPPAASEWSDGQLDVTGCLDGEVTGVYCEAPNAIAIRALVTRVPEPSASLLALTAGATLGFLARARRVRRGARTAPPAP